jgi:hypothetical protein
LSPLSDFADPLASLPAVATSNALPSGGLNPYSSPAPRSSVSAASQVRRTGLPWETGSEGGFYETAKLVLFRPVTAFQMVHRKRGVGEPMSYVASCATLALVMNIIYLTLFIVLILTAAGKLDQVSGVKVGIFVAQLIMSSVGGIVGAIMSPLLAACVFHIGLLIVGSGQAGYEGTYRVCAYSYGSSMLLAIVPLLGLLAMPWYCIALLMIGFKNVHEGAYWQAAFATIFPYGAMMLCCCGLQFLGAMLS